MDNRSKGDDEQQTRYRGEINNIQNRLDTISCLLTELKNSVNKKKLSKSEGNGVSETVEIEVYDKDGNLKDKRVVKDGKEIKGGMK